MTVWALRDEAPSDAPAVAALLRAAFGGEDEAGLVADLRAAGGALVALVAEGPGGEVVGHVMFSPLEIAREGQAPILAAALAPLAVAPAWQRRGIGAALAEAGLARCRDLGVPGAVVLGDPAYYRRFGFDAARAAGFSAPWAGPALQALDLAPPGLGDGTGALRYHPAFDRFVDSDEDGA